MITIQKWWSRRVKLMITVTWGVLMPGFESWPHSTIHFHIDFDRINMVSDLKQGKFCYSLKIFGQKKTTILFLKSSRTQIVRGVVTKNDIVMKVIVTWDSIDETCSVYPCTPSIRVLGHEDQHQTRGDWNKHRRKCNYCNCDKYKYNNYNNSTALSIYTNWWWRGIWVRTSRKSFVWWKWGCDYIIVCEKRLQEASTW